MSAKLKHKQCLQLFGRVCDVFSNPIFLYTTNMCNMVNLTLVIIYLQKNKL